MRAFDTFALFANNVLGQLVVDLPLPYTRLEGSGGMCGTIGLDQGSRGRAE
jgi:hypothetical protein